jgi:hypothetical protein
MNLNTKTNLFATGIGFLLILLLVVIEEQKFIFQLVIDSKILFSVAMVFGIVGACFIYAAERASVWEPKNKRFFLKTLLFFILSTSIFISGLFSVPSFWYFGSFFILLIISFIYGLVALIQTIKNRLSWFIFLMVLCVLLLNNNYLGVLMSVSP